MQENIVVSNLLPEPDKKDGEEDEKDEDNLPHFDGENEDEKNRRRRRSKVEKK